MSSFHFIRNFSNPAPIIILWDLAKAFGTINHHLLEMLFFIFLWNTFDFYNSSGPQCSFSWSLLFILFSVSSSVFHSRFSITEYCPPWVNSLTYMFSMTTSMLITHNTYLHWRSHHWPPHSYVPFPIWHLPSRNSKQLKLSSISKRKLNLLLTTGYLNHSSSCLGKWLCHPASA